MHCALMQAVWQPPTMMMPAPLHSAATPCLVIAVSMSHAVMKLHHVADATNLLELGPGSWHANICIQVMLQVEVVHTNSAFSGLVFRVFVATAGSHLPGDSPEAQEELGGDHQRSVPSAQCAAALPDQVHQPHWSSHVQLFVHLWHVCIPTTAGQIVKFLYVSLAQASSSTKAAT